MSEIATILGGACIVLGLFLLHPGLSLVALGVGLLAVARAVTE